MDPCIDISINVAWKMWGYAEEMLVETLREQFRQLRSYTAKVLRTNISSTVISALQKQIFSEDPHMLYLL